jgi:pyruvate/2-oxoglutarate dehydrogenase complex dihydrolipoamide dehydrogenase (E3) component
MTVTATTASRQLTFDNLIIATGSVTRMLPGVQVSKNVVTYEEQILDPEPARPRSSSPARARSASSSPTS